MIIYTDTGFRPVRIYVFSGGVWHEAEVFCYTDGAWKEAGR